MAARNQLIKGAAGSTPSTRRIWSARGAIGCIHVPCIFDDRVALTPPTFVLEYSRLMPLSSFWSIRYWHCADVARTSTFTSCGSSGIPSASVL